MQFLMLVCVDREPVAEPESSPDVEEWVQTNDSKGIRLIGNALHPEQTAKVVRVRKERLLVTDGPFLETKELLAGFDVLECADLDEALAVAAAHPMAYRGVIELRPMIAG